MQKDGDCQVKPLRLWLLPQDLNSPPCQEHLALDAAKTVTSHCQVRFQSLFAQVLFLLSSVEEPQASLC